MREFMSEGAINLRVTMINQPGIQRDQSAPKIGASSRAAQTRIPFHTH